MPRASKRQRRRGRKRGSPRQSPKSQLARNAALRVLSLMRTEGKSLAAAMRQAQTTKRTVLRYVSSALIRETSGRYRAKSSDRFARDLHFLTPAGQIAITVRSSRAATQIAEYWAAVDHYLKTGDTQRLDQFRGKAVRAGKLKLPFVTDPKVLNRVANAGEVSFEDLYAISN